MYSFLFFSGGFICWFKLQVSLRRALDALSLIIPKLMSAFVSSHVVPTSKRMVLDKAGLSQSRFDWWRCSSLWHGQKIRVICLRTLLQMFLQTILQNSSRIPSECSASSFRLPKETSKNLKDSYTGLTQVLHKSVGTQKDLREIS